MEWISVKDGLPEEDDRYAVLYRFKDAKHLRKFVADYDPIVARWATMMSQTDIEYWMPLPEPPNMEEERLKQEMYEREASGYTQKD